MIVPVRISSNFFLSFLLFLSFFYFDSAPLQAQRAFVLSEGDRQVTVVDLETRTVVDAISVSGRPATLAAAPDGRQLVTANRGFLSFINPADLMLEGEIDTKQFGQFSNLSVLYDGRGRAYSVDAVASSVLLFDAADRSFQGFGFTFPRPVGPVAAVIEPDSNDLITVNFGTADLTRHRETRRRRFFTAFEEVLDIPVGNLPVDIALLPGTSTAYVANFGGNSIAVVDIDTGEAIDSVGGIPTPTDLVITDDGLTVFVIASEENAIFPIDVATGSMGDAIPVGNNPSGLALAPDGNLLAVTNRSDNSLSLIDVDSRSLITTINAVGDQPVDVVVLGTILPPASEVVARVVGLDSLPSGCDFTLGVELRSPQNIGSFTATLSFDPEELVFVGDEELLGGFNGVINFANANSGLITFNGTLVNGRSGVFDVLSATFRPVGAPGMAPTVEINFSSLIAALTFEDLLSALQAEDYTLIVGARGLLGDVNGDGRVNSTDALLIITFDGSHTVDAPLLAEGFGDVNGDGLTNTTDALIILSFDTGAEVPYPLGEDNCPNRSSM